jgi:hypothetical protein
VDKEKIIFKDIENLDEYINKSYFSDDLKNQIISSDIVILPMEGFRDYKGPLFPRGTESAYLYLKKNLPSKYNIEIAIYDEDYKELSVNYALVDIGIFMLTAVLLPLFLNLLANYIFYKFSSKDNNVKFKIILTDKLKLIDYEGSVDNFKIITKELKKISKNE